MTRRSATILDILRYQSDKVMWQALCDERDRLIELAQKENLPVHADPDDDAALYIGFKRYVLNFSIDEEKKT